MYDTKKEINELVKKFNIIKEKGYVKSTCNHLGGIGITFEHMIGNNENDFEIPDYKGIEIKTKRAYSKSYTGLFNCVPTGPHFHEVERLKEKYGYPDKILKSYKILNTSVYTTEKTKVGIYYYFQLKVDRVKQKIYLNIYDFNNKLIENCVYWDFDILKEKLYRKLRILAFIKAYVKKIEKQEYFKYYDLKLYELKDFDTFIKLIEKGLIRINFKIGVFRKGNKLGKIHDHGTSFSIQESNLINLYNHIK